MSSSWFTELSKNLSENFKSAILQRYLKDTCYICGYRYLNGYILMNGDRSKKEHECYNIMNHITSNEDIIETWLRLFDENKILLDPEILKIEYPKEFLEIFVRVQFIELTKYHSIQEWSMLIYDMYLFNSLMTIDELIELFNKLSFLRISSHNRKHFVYGRGFQNLEYKGTFESEKGLYRVEILLLNNSKIHPVWKLYELSSQEYDNYIQMIPLEILEDVTQLLGKPGNYLNYSKIYSRLFENLD